MGHLRNQLVVSIINKNVVLTLKFIIYRNIRTTDIPIMSWAIEMIVCCTIIRFYKNIICLCVANVINMIIIVAEIIVVEGRVMLF